VKIDLVEKNAVVTGGGRGIGRACALALAEAGANVIVTYRRDQDEAERTVQSLRRFGQRAEAVEIDVAKPQDIERLFEYITTVFTHLDILVNNAGVTGDGLVGVLEINDWDQVMDINLRGPFLCTRAALPLMMPRGRGKIINMASVAAVRAQSGHAAYSASKGGLTAFTRACAVEFARKGIQVNAVLPGFVATDMTKTLRQRAGARLLNAIPAGRFAEAGEVAAAVVFLASNRADYITGQTIIIDGGLSIA
jgi:3-oxoacyl-[acyl-carrier protein] reductase